MGPSYSLTTFLCFLMIYISLLMPALAQSCPEQCSCFDDKIECVSPNFPIELPPRNISWLMITGNVDVFPANAIMQPDECNIKRFSIYSSLILEVSSYSLSGLRAEIVHLNLLAIVTLQPNAFAGINCREFLVTFSTIFDLPMSSFTNLYSEELIIDGNSLGLVSLKPSDKITVDRITITHCYICEFDTQFPIGKVAINISLNQIQSFYKDATLGGEFWENQISCDCNLTATKLFTNYKDRNYLSNNYCLDPPDLEGKPLNDLNPTDICKRTKHAKRQCLSPLLPKNSASKSFELNQTLIFFVLFLLNNPAYRLW